MDSLTNDFVFTKNNYYKICRICFETKSEVLWDLSQSQYEEITLSNLLDMHCTEKLEEEISLPGYICLECINNLLQIHTFKEKIKESTALLKTAFKYLYVRKQESTETSQSIKLSYTTYSKIPSFTLVSSKPDKDLINDTIQVSDPLHDDEIKVETTDMNEENTENCEENAENSEDDTENSEDDTENCEDNTVLDHDDDSSEEIVFSKVETSDKLTTINSKCKTKEANLENDENQSFKCTHCDKDFSTKRRLSKHCYKSHFDVNCPVCDLKLKRGSLMAHLRRKHEEFDLSQLKKEKSESNDEKHRLCKTCGKNVEIAQYEDHLELHKTSVDSDKKSSVKCNLCEKSFPHKASLYRHRSSVHKQVKCHVCGLTLKRSSIEVHLRRKHDEEDLSEYKIQLAEATNNKRYLCKKCGKSIKKIDYKEHWQMHKTKENKEKEESAKSNKVKCNLCEKYLPHRDSLYRHRSSVHNQVKCHVCGLTLKRSSIELHLRRKHEEKDLIQYKIQLAETTNNKRYLCKKCGKSIRRIDYKEHWQMHKTKENKEKEEKEEFAKSNKVKCDLCEKYLPHRDSLYRHRSSVHNQVKCHVCGLTLKRASIEVHLQRKHGEADLSQYKMNRDETKNNKQYVCKKCGKSVAKLEYKDHLEMHKIESKRDETNWKFQCNLCWKMFPTNKSVDKHRYSVHGHMTCPICDLNLKRASYRVHLRRKHKDVDSSQYKIERKPRPTPDNCNKRRLCEICGKTVGKNHYQEHVQLHKTPKPFGCDQCDFKCSFKINLERHKMRHTGEKAFLCTECGHGFTQKRCLDEHMKMHTVLPEPKICSYCPEIFKTKYEFRKHQSAHGLYKIPKRNNKELNSTNIKSSTTAGNNRECHICHEVFTYRAYYAHVKLHNPDVYRCTICRKQLANSEGLKIHMRAHLGLKPFPCTHCPKTFSQRSHLHTHVVTQHENQRAYRCAECGKGFNLRGSLAEHARIHTGETLDCGYCDKVFKHGSNRYKHLRAVHGVRLHEMRQKRLEQLEK